MHPEHIDAVWGEIIIIENKTGLTGNTMALSSKNTDGLHQALISSQDLDEFLAENHNVFINESAAENLYKIFVEKGISKAALAKQSGMSEIYLHQIFAGRRHPSRNKLLCLCFGLQVSLEEAQDLLKLCGLALLYPKFKRDAIIIYGLVHGLNLFETNDKLFAENEETLC